MALFVHPLSICLEIRRKEFIFAFGSELSRISKFSKVESPRSSKPRTSEESTIIRPCRVGVLGHFPSLFWCNYLANIAAIVVLDVTLNTVNRAYVCPGSALSYASCFSNGSWVCVSRIVAIELI
jgi:hypothetical protein